MRFRPLRECRLTGDGRPLQEESRKEARSATERMIVAQAEMGRAKQRAQQLAAEYGASPELPPVSDADVQVGPLARYTLRAVWSRQPRINPLRYARLILSGLRSH